MGSQESRVRIKSICSLLSAFCALLAAHRQALPARPASAGHAILFPRHPRSISEVMESIKVSSTRIQRLKGPRSPHRGALKAVARQRKMNKAVQPSIYSWGGQFGPTPCHAGDVGLGRTKHPRCSLSTAGPWILPANCPPAAAGSPAVRDQDDSIGRPRRPRSTATTPTSEFGITGEQSKSRGMRGRAS